MSKQVFIQSGTGSTSSKIDVNKPLVKYYNSEADLKTALQNGDIAENEIVCLKAQPLDTITADNTALPLGSILPYYGTAIPKGYLACDGAEFDILKYPLLYELLGDNKTPDLREVVLVGVGEREADDDFRHDVYTLGEFKDDVLASHKHELLSGQFYYYTGTMKEYHSGNGVNPITVETEEAGEGNVTHGKQVGIQYCIKATYGATTEEELEYLTDLLSPLLSLSDSVDTINERLDTAEENITDLQNTVSDLRSTEYIEQSDLSEGVYDDRITVATLTSDITIKDERNRNVVLQTGGVIEWTSTESGLYTNGSDSYVIKKDGTTFIAYSIAGSGSGSGTTGNELLIVPRMSPYFPSNWDTSLYDEAPIKVDQYMVDPRNSVIKRCTANENGTYTWVEVNELPTESRLLLWGELLGENGSATFRSTVNLAKSPADVIVIEWRRDMLIEDTTWNAYEHTGHFAVGKTIHEHDRLTLIGGGYKGTWVPQTGIYNIVYVGLMDITIDEEDGTTRKEIFPVEVKSDYSGNIKIIDRSPQTGSSYTFNERDFEVDENAVSLSKPIYEFESQEEFEEADKTDWPNGAIVHIKSSIQGDTSSTIAYIFDSNEAYEEVEDSIPNDVFVFIKNTEPSSAIRYDISSTYVDLSIYNSSSNYFTIPKDGYLNCYNPGTSNSVTMVRSANTGAILIAATGVDTGDANYDSVFVKKGMKVYSSIPSGSYARYYPLEAY